jgi:hypothetical protein
MPLGGSLGRISAESYKQINLVAFEIPPVKMLFYAFPELESNYK